MEEISRRQYNYYVDKLEYEGLYPISFQGFIEAIKNKRTLNDLKIVHGGIPKSYSKMGEYNNQ